MLLIEDNLNETIGVNLNVIEEVQADLDLKRKSKIAKAIKTIYQNKNKFKLNQILDSDDFYRAGILRVNTYEEDEHRSYTIPQYTLINIEKLQQFIEQNISKIQNIT